jgi:hypothetical protein
MEHVWPIDAAREANNPSKDTQQAPLNTASAESQLAVAAALTNTSSDANVNNAASKRCGCRGSVPDLGH